MAAGARLIGGGLDVLEPPTDAEFAADERDAGDVMDDEVDGEEGVSGEQVLEVAPEPVRGSGRLRLRRRRSFRHRRAHRRAGSRGRRRRRGGGKHLGIN
jgi:hypothetical protein